MNETLLPPEAHVAAAKIEDALTVWNARRPDTYVAQTKEAGMRAAARCSDLINIIAGLRDRVKREIQQYTKQSGGGHPDAS